MFRQKQKIQKESVIKAKGDEVDMRREIEKMVDTISYLSQEIKEVRLRDKEYEEREKEAKKRELESQAREKHNLKLIAELKRELKSQESGLKHKRSKKMQRKATMYSLLADKKCQTNPQEISS